MCSVFGSKTAAYYYLRLREIIALTLEQECHEVFGGEAIKKMLQ